MYIAMNRFRVVPGYEEAFEAMWRGREGRLAEMPGYVEFHMLKGPKSEDHTLYASHTVWETFEHFQAWTKSDQFRAYLSGPHFEGFEVIIHEDRHGARAADAA